MRGLSIRQKESLFDHAYGPWPGTFHEDGRNAYADFRYDFRIKHNKGPARLAITADQSYMLYFNGAYIGRGPAEMKNIQRMA